MSNVFSRAGEILHELFCLARTKARLGMNISTTTWTNTRFDSTVVPPKPEVFFFIGLWSKLFKSSQRHTEALRVERQIRRDPYCPWQLERSG